MPRKRQPSTKQQKLTAKFEENTLVFLPSRYGGSVVGTTPCLLESGRTNVVGVHWPDSHVLSYHKEQDLKKCPTVLTVSEFPAVPITRYSVDMHGDAYDDPQGEYVKYDDIAHLLLPRLVERAKAKRSRK